MTLSRRSLYAVARFERAQQCKRCEKVMREGVSPILWVMCDRCQIKLRWWSGVGVEIALLVVVALFGLVWVLVRMG